MKKLMLVSLFVVLLTPYLVAQDKSHDGYWWKSIDDNQRTFFVAGFTQGALVGHAQLRYVADAGNPNKDTKFAIEVAQVTLDYSDIYVGQVRDGVTSVLRGLSQSASGRDNCTDVLPKPDQGFANSGRVGPLVGERA